MSREGATGSTSVSPPVSLFVDEDALPLAELPEFPSAAGASEGSSPALDSAPPCGGLDLHAELVHTRGQFAQCLSVPPLVLSRLMESSEDGTTHLCGSLQTCVGITNGHRLPGRSGSVGVGGLDYVRPVSKCGSICHW